MLRGGLVVALGLGVRVDLKPSYWDLIYHILLELLILLSQVIAILHVIEIEFSQVVPRF